MSEERTKSALIVALTRENEQLRNINKKLYKRIIQGNWLFGTLNAFLSLYLNYQTVHRTPWCYHDIKMHTRISKTRKQTKKCIKFVKEAHLPEGTNSFDIGTGDVRIYYTKGVFTIINKFREFIIHERNGFDIIRRLMEYCSDQGHPIPITIGDVSIVDREDPDIADLGKN
jgi:hypothetical protein